MKKYLSKVISFVLILCAMFTSIVLSSCSNNDSQKPYFKQNELTQLCQLSTIKCTIHTFIKAKKDESDWIKKLFNPDKAFSYLVEFDAEFDIGLDFNGLSIDEDTNTVYVEVSEPKLLSSKIIIDTLDDYPILLFDENNVYLENKKLDLNDCNELLADAKQYVEELIQARHLNYEAAESNAKTLIENHIMQIGQINGISYTIEWVKPRKED